ncbi:MAG TPA: hypothetical protein VL992_01675 [Tepidisphaeraceae bacterium]|nr:hypothetical protein [Tepidisphaeraceae bacterium]
MIRRPVPDIDALFAAGTPIDEALNRGIRRALLRHKKLGESVVGTKDGKPVIIPPEEIPVFDDEVPPPRR